MSLFYTDITVFGQHSLAYTGASKKKAGSGSTEESPSTLPVDNFQSTKVSRTPDGRDQIATTLQAETPGLQGGDSIGSGAILLEHPVVTDSGASGTPLVAGYERVTDAAQVAAKAAQLPQIARSLIMTDINEVFGTTPQRMAGRYQIDLRKNPELKPTLENVHAFAFRALDDLSTKILKYTEGGEFHNLDAKRLSTDRTGDAVAQHVGYVAGEISRSPDIKEQPGREISRVVLRKYFEGTLNDTRGDGEKDPKALLISELSKAAGDTSGSVASFINDPSNAGLFSKEKLTRPEGLLPNLAAYHAGDAVLQFAAKLMNGDDRRAEAFVKYVFSRPVEELNQMVSDPQGLPALLVNFSAVAHHQAWQWSKLGMAGVSARAGDSEAAVKQWNHERVGSSLKVATEDKEAALKIAEQVESYLVRDNKLVPCERGKATGKPALQTLLQHVERHGIYANNDDGMRILSNQAVEAKERLRNEVLKMARLDDWSSSNELAADLVANTCASFASQAVNADFQEKDSLVSLYRGAIGRFAPEVDKLVANGPPNKNDPAYQAFFQEKAGEFGFEALKSHLGTGAAHDLVRNASIAHIIPIALEALRLPDQPDYTPTRLVADMEELRKTLLKGDYFLDQPGFMDSLREEAARPSATVDRHALENGIRVPNAVWMWTQLTRGLVEEKPGRYTGSDADLGSDKFPSAVQFSPPDIRDVELFVWARHRLTQHGYEPQDATRMALATVVITLHKDLLQMRKAS